MKKLIALMLTVVMLAAVCCASAEESTEPVVVPYDDSNAISFVLPDGYAYQASYSGQMLIIEMEKTFSPKLVMVVGVDEEYPDLQSLNDLSDEELNQYAGTLLEDWANASVNILTTDYGTKIIVIDEDSADVDMCQLQGIYKGFTFCVYVIHTNGSEITDKDRDAAMKYLSNVWLVETAAE